MDQHSVSDGPEPAQSGSLCGIAVGASESDRGGLEAGAVGRDDAAGGSLKHDGLPQRKCDLRSIDARRSRVPRGAPPPLRREFDASAINLILNHPDVFEQVSAFGIESIDLGPLVDDVRNVLLMCEGGGIFFNQHEPGIYEVHTNFLKGFRGRHAILASLAAYRWMFTHTDCMVLLTRVPAFNRAAEWFCHQVGATKEFERAAIWKAKDGGLYDMSFWALRYDDWIRQTPDLMRSAREYRARLDQEYERHFGVSREAKPAEECHDLHVGAAIEMIYGGHPEKAVVLKNRWGRFSGYGLMAMLSREPLIIDTGEAVLQIFMESRTFKALKWS
jgi:hypothetical protein